MSHVHLVMVSKPLQVKWVDRVYDERDDALERADEIEEKFPDYKANVYSKEVIPGGERGVDGRRRDIHD